jgi:2-C-methyl-D-erythritol 4-phosphate cytidylyltransferase
MGSDVPKPFLILSGKTILQRSVECFLSIEGLDQVIVATSKDYLDDCQKIFDKLKGTGVFFLAIEGGTERQYSIQNALNKLDENIELVAIHDAVRPFVHVNHIRNCFKEAAEFGGAVLGVPAKDTIKKVNSEYVVEETPDRSLLWQAQTPQVFKKDLIRKAYTSAITNNFLGTDDASLVERIGGKVKMVEGDRGNFKITYPLDLKVAELILMNNS